MSNNFPVLSYIGNMNTFSHVLPGFRFHPTDEELVDYYLRKKIAAKRIDLDVIKDVDLYKIEPWDLEDLCTLGSEEQNEWYFFSHKDKKYPTGTHTNRATKAGFWKATGRDKGIYSKHNLVGMRKTLVYYKGRAPNGQKSDWIMHEYRLETNENGATQEEGWVVCRVFKKQFTAVRRLNENESLCWYDDQVSFKPHDFESSRRISHPYTPYRNQYPSKQDLELQYNMPQDSFLQLPQLESPKVTSSTPYGSIFQSTLTQEQIQQVNINLFGSNNNEQAVDQVMSTDWRVLDKFVASQLSQEDGAKENTYTNPTASSIQIAEHLNGLLNESKRDELASECASISTYSCEIDQ